MNPTAGTAFTLPFPLFALFLALAIALAPLILALAPFVGSRAGAGPDAAR